MSSSRWYSIIEAFLLFFLSFIKFKNKSYYIQHKLTKHNLFVEKILNKHEQENQLKIIKKKLFNSNQAVTLGVDLLFALLMAFTFVSYTFFTTA